MSKSTRVAVAVIAVGLAYPAASWLLGGQVESALAAQHAQLSEQPYLKIAERSFERGVFRSTERVTVEINGLLMRELARAAAGDAEAAAALDELPPTPLRFTLRSDIAHGPLPGLRALAVAVADTELEFDAATQQQVATLFGDRPPLALRTVYRFDGGGVSTLSSPAFATTLARADGGERRVEWDGLALSMDFARGLQRYTLHGEAPKLRIADERVQVVVTGIGVAAEQQRLFEDETLLYAGTQKMSIGELRVEPAPDAAGETAALLLQDVAYDIATPAAGEFVDVSARLGARVLRVGEVDYGPAHYDLSLKHLHARTLAALSRAAMSLYSDAALQQAQEGAPDEQMLAALAAPAMTLLSHNPELDIERVSFNSPHGEAVVSLRLRPNGLQAEDMNNPFALLGKIELAGSLSVPERLLVELDAEGGGAVVEQQLAAYAAQGLLRREQGFARSELEFKAGQLRVNGKPVNPFALGAGAGPEEDLSGLAPRTLPAQ